MNKELATISREVINLIPRNLEAFTNTVESSGGVDGYMQSFGIQIQNILEQNDVDVTSDDPNIQEFRHVMKNMALRVEKVHDTPKDAFFWIETFGRNLLQFFIGTNPNELRKLMDTTLSYGSIEDLEKLFEYGMDIDQTDYEGRTALQMFSAKGRKDAVDMLIARGANINAIFMYQGRLPKTALDAATECGRNETVAILRANGAKLGSEIV